jgi:Mg/Co/Ni transporter MgtE
LQVSQLGPHLRRIPRNDNDEINRSDSPENKPDKVPLSESIGIQSVVLTIERWTNRLSVSDWRSALRSLGREGGIAALLAVACAALVGVVAVAWQRDARLTAVIALSIPAAMVTIAVIGQ